MMVGALDGLATFVSDYLSKPEVDIRNLEALMGMIYGIQLMAETHSTNLDSYEVKLIDEKYNR